MTDPIDKAFTRIARSMPKGAELGYHAYQGGLALLYLRMPGTRTGAGTRALASILAEADARGLAVELQVDPCEEPDMPSRFELVRWYARFGFTATSHDENDWIVMERPLTELGPEGAADILARYQAARATDLDQKGFEEIIEGLKPRYPRF